MPKTTKTRTARRTKDMLQLRIEVSEGSRILDSIEVDLEDEHDGEHLMEEISEVLAEAGFEFEDDDDE